MVVNKMEKFYDGVNRKNTNCKKWDIFESHDINSFWIADSDYPTCIEAIEALKKRVNHGAFGYTYVSDDYYQAIIDWVNKNYHYEIKKEWVVPSLGVVTALYLIVNLFTSENDSVMVSTPVYNPFYNVILNNNRKLVCNKLVEENDTYTIDFSDFSKKAKDIKMYILCNPHNPVGRCFTKEELEKIVTICKENNVILVSDEIHADIIMNDSKFYSIGNFLEKYEDIIICTAPSKTFNIAGLQDANIIIKDSKMREKFTIKQNDLSINTPNILALEACKACYQKGYEWVLKQNEYLTENRDYVYSFFKEKIPSAKVYKLEGTYLMWVNLSYLNIDQDDLINRLKKEGVIVNSGTIYDKDYIGYIRINIATSKKNLIEGLEKIKKVVYQK